MNNIYLDADALIKYIKSKGLSPYGYVNGQFLYIHYRFMTPVTSTLKRKDFYRLLDGKFYRFPRKTMVLYWIPDPTKGCGI